MEGKQIYLWEGNLCGEGKFVERFKANEKKSRFSVYFSLRSTLGKIENSFSHSSCSIF